MSLDYDVTAVPEEWKADGDEWQTTQAIIFATMTTGIGNIKDEATADEFHTRWVAADLVYGPSMSRWDGKDFTRYTPTLAEVRRRVGLKTNASPLTRAAFKRRMADALMDEARRTTDRQRKEAK